MIISHKYKFIFIKTYKTAGTSLEAYLSEYCGEDDVVTAIYPPLPTHRPQNVGPFYNHMPATDVRNEVGDVIWNSYYKFCVERNPWDKVLSFYWMERSRNGNFLNFDEFLTRDLIGFNWPLYSDENQVSPIVDKVLRYETLGRDLAAVFCKLGVPWAGELKHRAKSEYRVDRRPYREVLTTNQVDIISRRFQKEIDWHGYEY